MNIEDKSSPQPTSETSFDSDTTTISIPDSSEKAIPADEKIRRALPDTTEAVGKTKKRYEPSKKEENRTDFSVRFCRFIRS